METGHIKCYFSPANKFVFVNNKQEADSMALHLLHQGWKVAIESSIDNVNNVTYTIYWGA